MKVSHLYDLDKYLSSAEINSVADKILFTKWERFVMWLARCTVRKLILRLTTGNKSKPSAITPNLTTGEIDIGERGTENYKPANNEATA
jgi:hypothetical protein